MLIYCDAGQNRSFNYFIFTNQIGKILGYKLYVRKSADVIGLVEGNAIIAALYWAKMRGGRNTVLTDFKSAIEIFYGKSKPADRQLYKLQSLLKQLVRDAGVNLTWIPRQLNVAGKLLETVPKGKASRDAERMLNFFKGAI